MSLVGRRRDRVRAPLEDPLRRDDPRGDTELRQQLLGFGLEIGNEDFDPATLKIAGQVAKRVDARLVDEADVPHVQDDGLGVAEISALDLATTDLFYDVAGEANLLSMTPLLWTIVSTYVLGSVVWLRKS